MQIEPLRMFDLLSKKNCTVTVDNILQTIINPNKILK